MAQIISKLRAGRGAGRTHPPATAPAGGAVGPRPPFRRRGHHLLLRHRHLLGLPLHRAPDHTFPLPSSVSDSLLLRLRRRSGRAATLFFLGRLRFLFRLCLGRLLHGVARGLTLAPGQASGFALVLVPRGGRRENTAATPGTCTTLEITRDADRQNKSIKPIVYHQGSVLHNLLQFNFNTASRTPRDSTGNKLRLSFVIRNHESPQKENCNLSPNVRLD
jgi:hypothetical protein